MTPDSAFLIANGTALSAWLLLLVLPKSDRIHRLTGTSVPIALSATYALLVALFLGRSPGGFDSLRGVALLFTNPWMLLAGWIHYLAFDLLMGTWEARDAAERGVPRWVLTPCLVLTFLLGPAGWLLYRTVRRRWSR